MTAFSLIRTSLTTRMTTQMKTTNMACKYSSSLQYFSDLFVNTSSTDSYLSGLRLHQISNAKTWMLYSKSLYTTLNICHISEVMMT